MHIYASSGNMPILFALIQMCVLIFLFTWMHTCIHTERARNTYAHVHHTHRDTDTHTYMHIHTHTRTHTHTQCMQLIKPIYWGTIL